MNVERGGGLTLVLVATRLHWDDVMPRPMTFLDEDKHKAPASTPLIPLSLQNQDTPASIPHSVVKNHQDAGAPIAPFGCHNSSGYEATPLIRSVKFIRGGSGVDAQR